MMIQFANLQWVITKKLPVRDRWSDHFVHWYTYDPRTQGVNQSPYYLIFNYAITDQVPWHTYFTPGLSELTFWGWVVCIYRHQAIIWTNAGILPVGSLGTNFIQILMKISQFSNSKIHHTSSILSRPGYEKEWDKQISELLQNRCIYAFTLELLWCCCSFPLT